ncbi:MAG: hypothetical protein GF383_10805 [Candidatus Lokiarchaeota archaeon]|nr:hypothetical protein [Candidatus Lokiarchaeota archaeon]MBD3341093.1 hypothetical protein [Candidatus Lokiarchaeota archaeon]
MVRFKFSNDFKGEGISNGLDRGLLVSYKSLNLVQEGMGLGTPALKTNTRTFFSRTSKLTKLSENTYKKTFYIDSELIWDFISLWNNNDNDYQIFTALINKLTDLYKKFSKFQTNLLKLGLFSQNLIGISSRIISRGILSKIVTYYEIKKNKVIIEVDFSNVLKLNKNQFKKICILNELGGNHFNLSISNGFIYPPPSGWVSLNAKNYPSLFSEDLNLKFNVIVISITEGIAYDFVYGRESMSNFCWAGYDIEIELDSIKKPETNHSIKYLCVFDIGRRNVK